MITYQIIPSCQELKREFRHWLYKQPRANMERPFSLKVRVSLHRLIEYGGHPSGGPKQNEQEQRQGKSSWRPCGAGQATKNHQSGPSDRDALCKDFKIIEVTSRQNQGPLCSKSEVLGELYPTVPSPIAMGAALRTSFNQTDVNQLFHRRNRV